MRTAPARRVRPDTAEQILDVAERLVQMRGFNDFSYADVSAELGITKASLHHHFRTKAELGRRLIERYHRRFAEALAVIDRGGAGAPAKLREYVALYADVLRRDRLCLCGMLAADFDTLPRPMKLRIRGFFDENERWLAGVLEEGVRSGSIRLRGSARDAARMVVGALEGAMLLARSYGDAARFDAAADQLLAELVG